MLISSDVNLHPALVQMRVTLFFDAAIASLEIRLVQVSLGNAAVALEGTDSGHQHAGAGGDVGIAALDIQELLGTQICTEASLRDDVIGQREAELGGHDAVAAVGDVGEGAAVDDGGVVLPLSRLLFLIISFSP